MAHYRRAGSVPAKRHTRATGPHGGLLFEELIGSEGFSGESALLYHRRSPSALCGTRAVDVPEAVTTPDHPLMPRHLRTSGVAAGGDAVRRRHLLMANEDVGISWVAATEASPLFRDAVGDELTYVQSGRARVETSFGSLDVGHGDYVVVPRSVTHRWVVTDAPLTALVLEAAGHVNVPERYLSQRGQLREGAPFCERDLRAPSFTDGPVDDDESPFEVLVRNRGDWSALDHLNHPFDVVGWDGALYPYAFNVSDFEPIVGATHQPPPVHQTFAGPGFVVCSFVPRPLDFGAGATKVPYHHSNADSDEVLFYSSGDFTSRTGSGIGVGSISVHPSGFVHGPHPGSVEAAVDATETNELAVMIDTFRPLRFTDEARALSDPRYPGAWAR